MIVETGHFALVLAFALALVQSSVPLVGARFGNERMMAVGGHVEIRGLLAERIKSQRRRQPEETERSTDHRQAFLFARHRLLRFR